MMVKMAIKCQMCVEVSNKNREKIMRFDTEIKKEFPRIYFAVDKSRLFFVLRRTHYWIYPVWRLMGK